MIEIREVKDSADRQLIARATPDERVFAFYEGALMVASLHLVGVHKKEARLTGLNTHSHGEINHHIVLEGLLRAACHALHRESVIWLLAKDELIQANEMLRKFFLPLSQQSEVEFKQHKMNDIGTFHEAWAMETGMIYNTDCKNCGK